MRRESSAFGECSRKPRLPKQLRRSRPDTPCSRCVSAWIRMVTRGFDGRGASPAAAVIERQFEDHWQRESRTSWERRSTG